MSDRLPDSGPGYGREPGPDDQDASEVLEQMREQLASVSPGDIVAEVNNGGEMVSATIRTVDPNVPVKLAKSVSHNVLAKISGSEHPDETIMMAAHWDAFGLGKPDDVLRVPLEPVARILHQGGLLQEIVQAKPVVKGAGAIAGGSGGGGTGKGEADQGGGPQGKGSE